MAHTTGSAAGAGSSSDAAFWTACPHCAYVHSYARLYVGRRLRCPTPACRRVFSADELPCAPPIVPGAEMYFCTWGFFPLGPPAVPEGWAPFTPFNSSPVHSPTPTPATATPARARPTARKKVGACLKGRARVQAEEEEEEEPVILEAEAEAEADWLGEKDTSGIKINENFNLSDLGFSPEEIDALPRDAVIDGEMEDAVIHGEMEDAVIHGEMKGCAF